MEQLSLDIGIELEDSLSRQTDRQTAADAGGENRQGKESSNSRGGYE